jgi:hypothetical protein
MGEGFLALIDQRFRSQDWIGNMMDWGGREGEVGFIHEQGEET